MSKSTGTGPQNVRELIDVRFDIAALKLNPGVGPPRRRKRILEFSARHVRYGSLADIHVARINVR